LIQYYEEFDPIKEENKEKLEKFNWYLGQLVDSLNNALFYGQDI